MVIATLMLTPFADAKEEKVVGEASTAYLTSPESAGFERFMNKIIIILRNPIERAYPIQLDDS